MSTLRDLVYRIALVARDHEALAQQAPNLVQEDRFRSIAQGLRMAQEMVQREADIESRRQ